MSKNYRAGKPWIAFCALIVPGVLALTSCKKEIQPNASTNQTLSNQISVRNESFCKPVVFGATIGYPGSNLSNRWITLMQKWYGENGNPAFLKAHFYTEMNDFTMLEHSIEWGVLSYHNNTQVYLKDGENLVMRVSVDEQQRPAASYYFHNHFPKGSYLADTAYYHFTGARLDAVERLYSDALGIRSQFEKFNFFYDEYGSLVRIDRWGPICGTSSMSFFYDYTKPVTDMMAIPQVTIPFKLLEYMDLLDFPIHHRLSQVTGFGNDWQFNNYSLTSLHLVASYEAAGLNQRTFYTGWDCSSVAPIAAQAKKQKNINSFEEFHRTYPVK